MLARDRGGAGLGWLGEYDIYLRLQYARPPPRWVVTTCLHPRDRDRRTFRGRPPLPRHTAAADGSAVPATHGARARAPILHRSAAQVRSSARSRRHALL